MRIQSVQLDRYGPLAGFEHAPTGGLEVVYGPNEAGKTLFLEGICRLLAPANSPTLGAGERVSRDPIGAVEVRHDGDFLSFEGDMGIGELDDRLTARTLRNVFVIRDSDLRLAGEHEFYDSVTEQIGDLHTGELDALAAVLKERGRLTPRTLRLSTAAEHDAAGDVRDAAATLAEDCRRYVAEARETGVEALERRRLSVARDLRRRREQLKRQERAERVHDHAELSAHLETYREAVEWLANSAVSADERDHLEGLRQEQREAERAVERLDRELAAAREERQAERERLRELESQLESYRAREATVEEVRDQLAAAESTAETVGPDRLGRFVAAMAVAGVLGGGLAAGLGAEGVGVAALAVGLVAAGGWLWLHRRRTVRERERADVVAAAQTAALSVEEVGEVRAAVEQFRTEFRRLESERQATANRVEQAEETISDLDGEREEATRRARAAAAEADEVLASADVADVGAYADAVAANEERVRERDRAAAVLESRLSPDLSDATPGERIAGWSDAIDELLEDEETKGIDPEDFDPERRDELAAAVDDLADEREEVAAALDEHERRLDDFAARARELDSGPFLDGSLELSARSLDGLEALATECEELVETVEYDAAVAREALDVVDSVRADEEAKIAALFGESGRAGAVLATITDGRYTDVDYDADERTLQVRRADGERFEPAALSHATTDQLYLAVRVALGEELLGHEPGFFLLDDPFLPADRERLERGMGVLDRLAEAGWQILYLTAKPEVGEAMAETYDLPVRELEGPV